MTSIRPLRGEYLLPSIIATGSKPRRSPISLMGLGALLVLGVLGLCAALLLGVGLLYVVSQAASERSGVAARHLLRATVIYLPLLCLCLGLFRTDPVAGWPL